MSDISSSFRKKLQKRSEQLSKKGGGSYPYFMIKEGVTRMRILPAPPEKEFAVEATFFFINKEIGGVISPITFGQPCALMELYNKLKNSKKESDREMAKKVQPKKRYFAFGYKYVDEKGKQMDNESGAKLVILTGGQYQDLIDLYLDEEAGDFTNRISGYDIKFKRTGSGMMDTVYTTVRCNPSKGDIKYKGKIFDPAVELKKIMPTYERTEEIAQEVFSASPSEGSVKKKKKKSF